MKKVKFFLPVLMFFGLLAACTKDPVEPNDEELITTIDIQFVDGSEIKHFTFRDLDGSGGDAPVISSDTLAANTTYTVRINLYNESISPIDTISNEVEEEGDEHQFFFILNPSSLATFTYGDSDVDGNPIGLVSACSTSNTASSGTLDLILRHQPDKAATNVSFGDISNAGGETDIEVSFNFVVE